MFLLGLLLPVSICIFAWNTVENAKGYILFSNDEVVGTTIENNITTSAVFPDNSIFVAKTVDANGSLSKPSGRIKVIEGTGIGGKLIQNEIYCINGTLYFPENDIVHTKKIQF